MRSGAREGGSKSQDENGGRRVRPTRMAKPSPRGDPPWIAFVLPILLVAGLQAQPVPDWQRLGLAYPARGFVSQFPAKTWEHSLIIGGGRMGALIPGETTRERVILSHEGLLLPVGGPPGCPPLSKYLAEIRRLTLEGRGEEASELVVKVGKENGFPSILTTNPLIPACVVEVEMPAGE